MTTYTLSIIVEGKDSASGPLGRVSSALGGMGTVMGGILGAGMITAVARQIVEFGKSAINATATMQAMKVGIEALVARELIQKDATLSMTRALDLAEPAAGRLLGQIRKLSVQSPYELGTVQDTFKLAMAFGFASDEAMSFTKGILNMSAGIGASDEMMGRMAYNLAQIRMQGKVTAVDVRQLAMAGFDLLGALKDISKQHGLTIESADDFNKAIEQGKIKWTDFAKDFEKYANKNFGGASARLAKTLQGLKSTFHDLFVLTMPLVLGPAAELVTGFLQDILGSFTDFSDSGALEVLGEQFANNIKPGIDAVRGFLTEIGLLGQGLEDMRGRGFEKIDFASALKEKIDNIDWNEIHQELWDGVVGLTKDFELWAKNVDWKKLSDDLEKGIDDIDWAALGVKVGESAKNIWGGISTSASEIDWLGIGMSLGNGLNEFLAGITGQGSVQNVIDTWTSNILTGMDISAKITFLVSQWGVTIATEWIKGVANVPFLVLSTILSWLPFVSIGLDTISNLFFTKANEAQGKAVAGLTGGGAKIDAVISAEWKPLIEDSLDSVKKTFFNKFQGAVQQAILALVGMTRPLIEAIESLIEEALGAIVPIVIPVSFGTPTGGNVGGQSTGGGAGSGGAGSGGGTTTIVPQVAGARGLSNFVVPPGFENDSFPVFASSGEVVNIDQPKTYRNSGGGGGGTIINVEVNIEKVDSEIDIYQMAYQIAELIRERQS